MWRLATLLWMMLGTVFAGVFVTVVLVAPSLAGQAGKFIPIAALIGAIVGIPVALGAAKAITSKTA